MLCNKTSFEAENAQYLDIELDIKTNNQVRTNFYIK